MEKKHKPTVLPKEFQSEVNLKFEALMLRDFGFMGKYHSDEKVITFYSFLPTKASLLQIVYSVENNEIVDADVIFKLKYVDSAFEIRESKDYNPFDLQTEAYSQLLAILYLINKEMDEQVKIGIQFPKEYWDMIGDVIQAIDNGEDPLYNIFEKDDNKSFDA